MPSPEKRPRGSYTARIKIPADLRDVYAAKFGQRWSIKTTWPKTYSQARANQECDEWVRQMTARFDALRAAKAGHLVTLDHRQVHALVGRWYHEFVGQYENSPGDAEGWQRALDDLGEALGMAGGHDTGDLDASLSDPSTLAAIRNDVELPAPDDPLIDRGYSIARATQADQWLMDHGYPLTRPSRDAFLDALAPRYADALMLLIKRAKGDFSRDPIAETFPTLGPIKTGTELSIRAVFNQWNEATKPAAGTISRWQGVIDVAEKRWPNLRRVTDADAREWVKGLVTNDRGAHTVNATWRTALKTLCNWAIDQGLLTNNPFTRAKVVVPRKITTRESKAFTPEEAHTILAAALAVEIRTPLLAAKRWLPWLCAYSGARAGEIAQLRGQDVTQREGVWAMLLTPEAGTIKNRRPRTVPLHEHLIAQGFLEFVKSRGKGPLFSDPRPIDAKTARLPSTKVVKQAGEWVRSLGITDEEIRPNHAWRHLFKLVAERAGIPERLSDVMTGHAPASIGRAYGAPQLSDLAREMQKFPRYEI